MFYGEYRSREEAIDAIAEIDRHYDFFVHELEAGEKVGSHIDQTGEWIIADNGEFEVMVDGETELFAPGLIPGHERTAVILIPAGKIHSLLAITDVSYWVLKS